MQLHRLIDKTPDFMDLTFISAYSPHHGFKVILQISSSSLVIFCDNFESMTVVDSSCTIIAELLMLSLCALTVNVVCA